MTPDECHKYASDYAKDESDAWTHYIIGLDVDSTLRPFFYRFGRDVEARAFFDRNFSPSISIWRRNGSLVE